MERNENGYSARAPRETSDADRRRNGTCPGTGEIWRGNGMSNGNGMLNGNGMSGGNGNNALMGEMSLEEFNFTHNTCSKHQLAMVYSPYQCFRMLYAPEKALMRGTLFEELDKPLEDCTNG